MKKNKKKKKNTNQNTRTGVSEEMGEFKHWKR